MNAAETRCCNDVLHFFCTKPILEGQICNISCFSRKKLQCSFFLLQCSFSWFGKTPILQNPCPRKSDSRGCRPPAPPLGRAGRRGTHFLMHFLWFLEFGKKQMGVYGLWEVSHLFSREISRRMLSESCLGIPWGRSYEHISKNTDFGQGRFGWDPWLKRASKTISNGILKVQNAWLFVNVMRILLSYHIISWHHVILIIYVTYFTVLYCIVLYYTLLYYTIHVFTV